MRRHDEAGVANFTDAMLERLEEKRGQGRGGWWDESQCSLQHLRDLFMQAVAKGNLVDIANFAMMIHSRENA